MTHSVESEEPAGASPTKLVASDTQNGDGANANHQTLPDSQEQESDLSRRLLARKMYNGGTLQSLRSPNNCEQERAFPPYRGPDAPRGCGLWVEPELDNFLHQTFQYYDQDDSGTLNEYVEMRNLTINLVSSLRVRIPGKAGAVAELEEQVQ